MKKLSVLAILLLIVGLLAVPALAAQNATMSVSVSNGTVHRGETFTVTVSTTAVENCKTGGFLFSYNSNVFEYDDGDATEAIKEGYAAGVSTANGNVAGYFMNGKTTVQGAVFQITLKVKDTAAYGSYTISGAPSLSATDGNVSCSVNGATVTVGNHNWNKWAKVDNTQHNRTCSVCGKEESANHTWDNGQFAKQPTCKEEGVKTYTCTGCSATKSEPVAKTNEHTYGSWTKVNDTQHKHKCSVCGNEESANHVWDNGKITKQPTCKEEGIKTYKCTATACSATKTEPVAKSNEHTYGNWSWVDNTQHKHKCSVCGNEESANHVWDNGKVTKQPTCKESGIITFGCTECSAIKTEVLEKLTTHTYDHACDTDCNVCGVIRTITHNYKTTWSKDGQNHWHECSVCKDKKDVAVHTPGAEATEYTPQTCTACGYIMNPALGHKHNYDVNWTTDEKGHWYACSGCNEKDSFAEHDFENDCDADCSICEYTREIKHAFSETWSTDDTSHWLVCTVCGLEQDKAAHVPGPEATATTAQTCTICDYEIAPALGEPETTTEATQPTTTESEAPAVDDEGGFQAWIIFVAVAVVAAGAGVVVIVKTKKV